MVFAFTNDMVSLTINDSKTCQEGKSVVIKKKSGPVMAKYFTCIDKGIAGNCFFFF